MIAESPNVEGRDVKNSTRWLKERCKRKYERVLVIIIIFMYVNVESTSAFVNN